jgi:hypothetical protein
MSERPEFEAQCRRLRYVARDGRQCAPQVMKDLELAVEEVSGTSPMLAAGEKYIMRGSYNLAGQSPVSVGPVVDGRSRGHYVDLAPGAGEFQVWMEVLELQEGASRTHIGLLVGTPEDRERDEVRTQIQISE